MLIMKPTQKKDLSMYRQTASRLRALLGDGMIAEGSLCQATLRNGKRWQLTRKANGRTETLYVPECDVATLREATQRWKRAKALMKGLSDQAWKIVRSGMRSRTPSNTGK